MRSRILAVFAAAVLALPMLAACGNDGSKKKCKSNTSTVQVFDKPGGGSGGGGKGGGGSKGGKGGGSKSKTGKNKKPGNGGGGVPVTNPTTKCKDKKK